MMPITAASFAAAFVAVFAYARCVSYSAIVAAIAAVLVTEVWPGAPRKGRRRRKSGGKT